MFSVQLSGCGWIWIRYWNGGMEDLTFGEVFTGRLKEESRGLVHAIWDRTRQGVRGLAVPRGRQWTSWRDTLDSDKQHEHH
jgi:hypothetical protein